MNDNELDKLIRKYTDQDPFVLFNLSKMLHRINSNVNECNWKKSIDYADMFFFVFQDVIRASSEKSLNLLLTPTYYRIIYKDYINRNIGQIIDESHVEAICDIMPSLVDLYLLVYCSEKNKEKADAIMHKIVQSVGKAERANIRATIELLIACGCMAKLYFASNQSNNIPNNKAFFEAVLEVDKTTGNYHDALTDLYVEYNKNYYDCLKIDDRFLFDCAITIYLNRKNKLSEPNTESHIDTTTCKELLKKWSIKRIKEKPSAIVFAHEIVDYGKSISGCNPRVLIETLLYGQLLAQKYKIITERTS